MGPTDDTISVIILAAGKGKRMRSDKAKVLHEVNGRPMISYVVDTAKRIADGRVVVVVGHQAETVKATIEALQPDLRFALQTQQLGTGHAVQCALPCLPAGTVHVVILCGDTPLVTAETIRNLVEEHKAHHRDLTVLAVEMEDPRGYGRMLIDGDNRVTGIVEEADATPEQRAIKIVNAGIYCGTATFVKETIGRLKADNAQSEFYLTDLMAIGRQKGKNVGALVGGMSLELLGVNTVDQLELVENIMKNRQGKTS